MARHCTQRWSLEFSRPSICRRTHLILRVRQASLVSVGSQHTGSGGLRRARYSPALWPLKRRRTRHVSVGPSVRKRALRQTHLALDWLAQRIVHDDVAARSDLRLGRPAEGAARRRLSRRRGVCGRSVHAARHGRSCGASRRGTGARCGRCDLDHARVLRVLLAAQDAVTQQSSVRGARGAAARTAAARGAAAGSRRRRCVPHRMRGGERGGAGGRA
jgi:hypothetical protein